jgi:hypothetical protein
MGYMPFRLVEGPSGRLEIVRAYPSGPELVATMRGEDGSAEGRAPVYADGTMLAAAPAMLDALEECTKHDPAQEAEMHVRISLKAYDRIRAALRLARGERE